MTTQTTPSLAPPQPPAAAVAAVPPSIQAFSKRRASSSSGAPKGTVGAGWFNLAIMTALWPGAHSKETPFLPPCVLAGCPRQAHSRAAASGRGGPCFTRPGWASRGRSSAASGRSNRDARQRRYRVAAALLLLAQSFPFIPCTLGFRQAPAFDSGLPAPLLAGKARAKAGSAGKARRQPMAAIQDAAAATPASFSRKRGQEAGASQQGQGATPAERSPPVQQQLQQQSARPSKQARRAEVLFDSLFSEEQEQVPPQQPAPRLAATPAAAAAAAAPTGCGGSPDLAAAVRRKLQKHQARFARRRGASQRQAEEDQA